MEENCKIRLSQKTRCKQVRRLHFTVMDTSRMRSVRKRFGGKMYGNRVWKVKNEAGENFFKMASNGPHAEDCPNEELGK